MPSSGPLHPHRDDASVVDATFELHTVPVFDIVYHHKAGGRDSDRSVNPDYHEGLELVLRRLAGFQATILGIRIDSSVAMSLEVDERELDLPFPISLSTTMDLRELRMDITRAQKSIARRPDALPGGGNDQKRIRITVAPADQLVSYEEFRDALLGRGSGVVSPNREASPSARQPSRGRPRSQTPTVKDLLAAGLLTPGSVLRGEARGVTWRVTMLVDGRVTVAGSSQPRRLGLLTNEVSGHSQSAMRLWSLERGDEMIPLSQLRDELAASAAWGGTKRASK